jgi:hypothetical protein
LIHYIETIVNEIFMASNKNDKWLLLIHQLPPQPNALRVKVWRRLHHLGAVAIKQSVYVLPFSEHSREDFSWLLKEILEGGGDGSISEVRFLEGLTDEQVIDLFHAARKSDYEKIVQEAELLLSEWTSGQSAPQDPGIKSTVPVSKLQRRLEEVASIDFFQTPERETAEILLKGLAARVSGVTSGATAEQGKLVNLRGKTWVTRKNLFVDRIACGWLIRRFIDREAVFKFIPGPRYGPVPGELRFDLFEAEFTHEGDRCTFETMIWRLGLQDRALDSVAEIVHDIDLKDQKYGRGETDGFRALLTGLTASNPVDIRRLEEGCRLFENLYAYFQGLKGEQPTTANPKT